MMAPFLSRSESTQHTSSTKTLMSSVSTKWILGFVDRVVWARLACVYVTVRPKPVSTANKSVALSSTDCFIRIRTLLVRCGGRSTLDPRQYVLYVVTLRVNGAHPPDGHFPQAGSKMRVLGGSPK